MTDGEKQKIIAMRRDGAGYGQTTEAVGIPPLLIQRNLSTGGTIKLGRQRHRSVKSVTSPSSRNLVESGNSSARINQQYVISVNQNKDKSILLLRKIYQLCVSRCIIIYCMAF